jgi:hypothetical protein
LCRKGVCITKLLIQALDHVFGINKGTQVESSCLEIDVEVLKRLGAKNITYKIFDKVEITCTRDLFLDALVLSLRIEKDGEYLSNVSKQVLVDAFISNNIRFKLLQLELLRIFIQDGLGSSSLDSNINLECVQLHVIIHFH